MAALFRKAENNFLNLAMTRIIIIGGGFAGVKCAQTLSQKLDDTAQIVLFNSENHLVFTPLLADVIGSSVKSA